MMHRHVCDRSAVAGPALSAGRHLGRARRQFRGVLRPCRSASTFACSIHPAGAKSRACTLPECTDEVWHGYLPERSRASSTASAPTAPMIRSAGIASIRNKLLLDPYARALAGDLRWSDALFGYRAAVAARRSVVRPARQRAAPCRNAWSTDDAFNWGDDRPPVVPWAGHHHLRGACARPDHAARRISARSERGTFAALAAPPMIEHSAPPRHHRHRADAGARLRAGPPPGAAGAAQLLGL